MRAVVALRLAGMMIRPTGVSKATIALPVVAFSVATAMLLIVVGGASEIFRWTGDDVPKYRALAIVAIVLLVVPIVTLASSAARLSARRRDDRLAILRLLGARPTLVTAVTVLESTAYALGGAILGVALYGASLPLVGTIVLRAEALGVAALWVGPTAIAVVAGVTVVSCISSLVGVRGVIISPLGVKLRTTAPRVRWGRLVVGAAAVVAAIVVMNSINRGGGFVLVAAFMAGVLAEMLLAIGLVGPLAVRLVATAEARFASNAVRLLAARKILDDPKGTWRSVGGVALTSFIAVVGGIAASLSSIEGQGEALVLAADIQTGVIMTLVISFVAVGCSVGVNQAAEVLDRREISISLDKLGVPRSVMERARYRAVLLPLAIASVAPAGLGILFMLPQAGADLVTSPQALVTIAVGISGGIAIVAVAMLATRPVAASVFRDERANA
jgi:hypothetical protein